MSHSMDSLKFSSSQKFDVSIIGCGPIGALMALTVAHKCRQKQTPPIKIALLDQTPFETLLNPTNDGRTFACTFATHELLQKLGVWTFLEEVSTPILDIFVSDGKDQTGVHYSHQTLGTPFGYIVESSNLRRAIFSKIMDFPEINILCPSKLETIQTCASTLEMHLSEGRTLTTRLLIGADGRYSKVRTLSHLEAFELPYMQRALVCHFSHKYPHRGWAIEAFYPEGPFAVLPLKGDDLNPYQSGLVWTDTPQRIHELSELSEGDFNHALSLKLDLDRYGEPHLLSKRWVYPLSALSVPTIIKPRIALLGDAAHGIHPVAGQGLNLGIRDIETLSEGVSCALSCGLDPGSLIVLDPFQRARRMDILSLLSVTHGLIKLFSNDSKILRGLRRTGLSFVNSCPPLKKFFITHAMGKT